MPLVRNTRTRAPRRTQAEMVCELRHAAVAYADEFNRKNWDVCADADGAPDYGAFLSEQDADDWLDGVLVQYNEQGGRFSRYVQACVRRLRPRKIGRRVGQKKVVAISDAPEEKVKKNNNLPSAVYINNIPCISTLDWLDVSVHRASIPNSIREFMLPANSGNANWLRISGCVLPDCELTVLSSPAAFEHSPFVALVAKGEDAPALHRHLQGHAYGVRRIDSRLDVDEHARDEAQAHLHRLVRAGKLRLDVRSDERGNRTCYYTSAKAGQRERCVLRVYWKRGRVRFELQVRPSDRKRYANISADQVWSARSWAAECFRILTGKAAPALPAATVSLKRCSLPRTLPELRKLQALVAARIAVLEQAHAPTPSPAPENRTDARVAPSVAPAPTPTKPTLQDALQGRVTCPADRPWVRIWDKGSGLRLYLQIGRRTSTWYVCARGGNPVRLGHYPALSLHQAREAARAYWQPAKLAAGQLHRKAACKKPP